MLPTIGAPELLILGALCLLPLAGVAVLVWVLIRAWSGRNRSDW